MDTIIVRSAALRLVLAVLLAVVSLVATTAPAHAAPSSPGVMAASAARAAPAAASAASAPSELRVASALFAPTRTEDGLDWHAHFILTHESAAEVEGGATGALRFALPLREGENVEPTFGVFPFVEGATVVGVLVDRTALDGRTVSAVVHQRRDLPKVAGMHLAAPVVAGSVLQIIDADLGQGTRLEVETGRILERAVGHVAPPGTSHAQRVEARRLTGYSSRVTGAAVYVRGDDVRAAGGLHATVVTAQGRAKHGTIALGIVFAAAVAALGIAFARLRNAASIERADALLAAELDALAPDGSGSSFPPFAAGARPNGAAP